MKTPRRPTDDDADYMYNPAIHGRNPGNMDIFTEADGAYFQSEDEETQAIVRAEQEQAQERVNKLLTKAQTVLTPRQYEVFVLIGVQCLTQQQVATQLGIGQPSVAELWDKCKSKLASLEGEIYGVQD